MNERIIQPEGLVWASEDDSFVIDELIYSERSLLVLGGIPGVGKSTFLKRHLPDNCQALEVDAIRERLQEEAQQQGNMVPLGWGEAFDELYIKLDKNMQEGQTTVLDVAGLFGNQRERIARPAIENMRPVHMLFLDGDFDLCVEGIQGRGRDMPLDTLYAYAEEWETIRKRLLSSPQEWQVLCPGYKSVTVLDRKSVDNLVKLSFI